MKPATKIAVLLFSLGAAAHALRLVVGFDIVVGGWPLPAWLSGPAALVAGGLAYLIVREHKA